METTEQKIARAKEQQALVKKIEAKQKRLLRFKRKRKMQKELDELANQL